MINITREELLETPVNNLLSIQLLLDMLDVNESCLYYNQFAETLTQLKEFCNRHGHNIESTIKIHKDHKVWRIIKNGNSKFT